MAEEILPADSPSDRSRSPITKQLAEYLTDITGALDVANLVFDLTEKAESVRKAMLEMESRLADHAEKRDEYQREKAQPGPHKQALSALRPLLFQMVFMRAVDSFLTYLSEMLAEIFRLRPETLRSGEMVRLDFVLQHSIFEDLISALADREVERLSYQGMRELSGELEKRIGFKLFEQSHDLDRAIGIIEMRNLIAHNRAIINRRFLSRVSKSKFVIGDKLVIEAEVFVDDLRFLERSAEDIDRRAAVQFGIERKEGCNG